MVLSNINLAGFTSNVSHGFRVPSTYVLGPLGDFNKDGIEDFGAITTGVFSVIWGKNGGFSSDLNVPNIVVPTQGINILSPQITMGVMAINNQNIVGSSFQAADFDNDGNLDIALVNAEKDAFIIWGSGSNMTTNIDLTNSSYAFTQIFHISSYPLGVSFAVMDFDANGWVDLFLSSPTAGTVFGIFNELDAFSSRNITMTSLTVSSTPKMITIQTYQKISVLSNIGYVTNDTYPVLAMGALTASNNFGQGTFGQVILLNGGANYTDVSLSTLSPSQFSVISGTGSGNAFGIAVTPLKDFNGDGIEDFAIGSSEDSAFNGVRGDCGQVMAFYGQNGSIPSIDLATTTPAANQATIFIGQFQDAQAGSSLGLMVNPDGTPIMLIGSPVQQYINNDLGSMQLVVGANGTYHNNFDLNQLTDPYGFSVYGYIRGDQAGIAVGSLGYITNGTYPSYYIAAGSSSGAFVLNGFNATSPYIAPLTPSPTTQPSPTTPPTIPPTSTTFTPTIKPHSVNTAGQVEMDIGLCLAFITLTTFPSVSGGILASLAYLSNKAYNSFPTSHESFSHSFDDEELPCLVDSAPYNEFIS